MKRPLAQTLGGTSLIGMVLFAACTQDHPVAPIAPIALPTGPLAIWIAPQPCQISLINPFHDNSYFATYIPTAGVVCDVRWHLSYPPNNDAFRGIYWFPDDPPSPAYSLFSTEINYTTYQNGPIEIILDSAVTNFSLVLSKERSGLSWEPAVLSPGHYMVAFNASGQEIGRVDFDAGGMISEKTLSVKGIRKVLVYPVIAHSDGWGDIPEAVGHRVSFAPDCAPTGDPLLDHPDFKAKYDSLMKRSNVYDPNPLNRREWGMLTHDDPNAPNGIRIDWPSVGGTAVCGVDFASLAPFSADTRGTIHNHMWMAGEIDPCGTPETRNKPFNPDVNGGAGDGDWDLPIGREHYVFTLDRIFRLTRSVPRGAARRNNPYRWKKGSNGCFSQYAPL
jgi:hypothetical protein